MADPAVRSAPLIGIVAGEASGDLLGAHLIQAVKQAVPGARFAGIAGPRMQGAGAQALFPMEKLAVRGYTEVLRNYLELAGMRRRLAAHLLRERPRLFVGIDAPDFNLDLELKLKAAGIPTVHYVSPSIWAWRGGRIHKIKRAVSKMLTLFPFEQAIYERAGVPVAYVGHPLAGVFGDFPDVAAMREQLRLPAAAKVVTLLPGSRVSELVHMADLFVAAARRIADAVPGARFLAPLVSRETRALFEAALYRAAGGGPEITMLFGHSHEAMAAADVVLVASGTATLEAALLRRPMVITYKVSRLTAMIHRHQGYLPYVGLPNILAGEFIVPEFLQEEATPENLSQAVVNLLFDAGVRGRTEARLARMQAELRQDTGRRAAEAILPLLAA
ncbi:MAG: lipid-A-disaccharide synthase [Betaproteobacteria bacterium]|nr:lipid-A-disaccharide synthase [Betaproteobacteria bacterium]MBI2508745.1 lipid-A-disaccharide synthase [Betaproteobacteria bacterium]